MRTSNRKAERGAPRFSASAASKRSLERRVGCPISEGGQAAMMQRVATATSEPRDRPGIPSHMGHPHPGQNDQELAECHARSRTPSRPRTPPSAGVARPRRASEGEPALPGGPARSSRPASAGSVSRAQPFPGPSGVRRTMPGFRPSPRRRRAPCRPRNARSLRAARNASWDRERGRVERAGFVRPASRRSSSVGMNTARAGAPTRCFTNTHSR